MFSSGMETARNGSGGGVGRPVLIPQRFVWPYGGRNVYLTGSFTRWSDHVPMIPVEGCPSMFHTVCSLAPGYHEYKFFVDGQWRHDQSKPCASGNYGVVNTIILGGDPSASSMDLDDVSIQHMIRAPDDTNQSPLSGLSQNAIEISRRRLSEYMSALTVYDMLPDSGKVIALDTNVAVKAAFHILYEQESSHAPLWDAYKKQFVGILSPLDFILILRELGNHRSNINEEELDKYTISAWKAAKPHLDRQIGIVRREASRGLIQAGPYISLKDLGLRILQSQVSTVLIVDQGSKDVSFPQCLRLTSLSDVLSCVCRYFQNCLPLLPILQLPICTLQLGTWVTAVGETNRNSLAVLRPNDRLSTALNLMLQAQVSSIPIVDDSGCLLDIYSRSDITSLAKDGAYAFINLDELTIGQALLFGNANKSSKCRACLRTDPLFKVMELLSKPGVRRLVVIEQTSRRVEGIISLNDVFKFFLG